MEATPRAFLLTFVTYVFLSMKERLIITLVEHPLWGILLQPTLVEELASGSLSILEIVDSNSTVFPQLDVSIQQLVRHAEHFSDKVLMKSYSREKTVADFHKNVKPETIEKFIRPLIEKYHEKMVKLVVNLPIEIYLREAVKKRTLYPTDRIYTDQQSAKSVFNFRTQDDGGLLYSVQVLWKDKILTLTNKTFGVICREPAIVCVDDALFVFENMDARKLLPFFEKEAIVVPAASRNLYIEKFVANCVRDYEVRAEGISIEQTFPAKKACLTFGNAWNGLPALGVTFDYGGKICSPNASANKIVEVVNIAGQVGIRWFYPDIDWERAKLGLLLSAGLRQMPDSHFELEQTLASENVVYSYIHWLQANPEMLRQFEFAQNLSEKTYYVGEVHLKDIVDAQQDWFDIKSIVEVGEFRIPFVKFRNHLIQGIHEYILPDGSILILPEEWFSKYQDIMFFGKKTADKLRLHKNQYQLLQELGIGRPPKKEETNLGLMAVPPEIRASLRPYQQKGFSWLVDLYRDGYGGCLGDDMGLGKTLQTITLLQHIANQKKEARKTVNNHSDVHDLPLFQDIGASCNDDFPPSLVVVPTSLIHNWVNELDKFAPSLKVYAYTGIKRMKTKDIDKFFRMFDVVLTTYGTLRVDVNLLKTAQFHHLIMDESQFVRNPDSLTFKAVKQIQAKYKLALTGTLIENSLTDLWAQFDIVNEGMLGPFSAFKKIYINPIVKENRDKQEKLLRMIRPFILRRTKQEVAPELPPLTEEVVYCGMSEEQHCLYEKEKSKIRNSLTTDVLQQAVTSNFAFLTLQGLTRLRLLANHPVLQDVKYKGTSGKFEQVMMNLEELIERNHKVLVFSSFVKHLRIFSQYFDEKRWKYAWLTGETLPQVREKQISDFQQNDTINCFFISLKAGGVGLNLTAADYVFILDPWWNPAAEMQALSRSHRIGQNKNVMVYRFISSGTIEEKIRRLQDAKSRLAETFMTSTNPLQGMTKAEIDVLLE
jgi:superfamily II DNA or RNA helicase